MLKISHLQNGLTLLRVPMSGVESVAAVVMVKAGSRYEEPRDFGVAHYLEHMVFKGTSKFPNNQMISRRVDGMGAYFNAFTSEEMTAFYIRSAAKDVELSLEMLGEMTTQMLVEPREIDKERGVILEEMHMYEDQPSSYNAQEFAKMFYGKSGLAHNIVGTRESIKKIEQKNFLRFIDRWYRPENMLIIIAGKKSTVADDDLLTKIDQYFKFRKFSPTRYQQESYWEDNFRYGDKLLFIDRQTEQTHFLLGWPALNRFSEQDAVLSVLQTILGGNMSSRLFSEVREKRGLCYYVYAQTEAFCDSGFFGAAAGVNPEKFTEAVEVTVDQFCSMASGKSPITAEELERAKNYLAGQMTLAQESVYNLALNYGTQYLFEQKIRTVTEELERIQKVTLDDVQALMKELIIPGELRFSAVGQISDQQKAKIETIIA